MASSLEYASSTTPASNPGKQKNESSSSSLSASNLHGTTQQTSTLHQSTTVDVIGSTAAKEPRKSLRSSIPSFVPTSQVVKLQSTMNRLKDMFTPTQSSTNLATEGASNEIPGDEAFATVKTATSLFPPTKPEVDGEECLHDCESCTVSLPRKWSIDESDSLYGHVKGWDYHVIVATGKSDWVRDVIDEKGSLMEGLGIHGLEILPKHHGDGEAANGGVGGGKRRRLMLSASDMPTGSDDHDGEYRDNGRTSVMLLPSWKLAEGVTTKEVPWLVDEVVASGPGNLDRLHNNDGVVLMINNSGNTTSPPLPTPTPATTITTKANPAMHIPAGISLKTIPHQALILMCSHKTRDARCGQSAPLLRREFQRHLQPLGLYRDLHDTRPGGVGIYFINHVGGHKYSANVMIYRRRGSLSPTSSSTSVSTDEKKNGDNQELSSEAVQGIWLARVRPEDCENIVRYTVLQGKVVKPVRQLRGGFDRASGLASW